MPSRSTTYTAYVAHWRAGCAYDGHDASLSITVSAVLAMMLLAAPLSVACLLVKSIDAAIGTVTSWPASILLTLLDTMRSTAYKGLYISTRTKLDNFAVRGRPPLAARS